MADLQHRRSEGTLPITVAFLQLYAHARAVHGLLGHWMGCLPSVPMPPWQWGVPLLGR